MFTFGTTYVNILFTSFKNLEIIIKLRDIVCVRPNLIYTLTSASS